MVKKTQEDEGLISDLVETFDNLRKFKMKLNPDKCAFGVPSGKLLGYMVSYHGTDPEKPSGQYLGFICDESLTRQGLNSNLGYFRGSAILPLFIWRIAFACLVVCRCGMVSSNEDHGRSMRPSVEDQVLSSTGRVLSGWVIRWSSDVVCDPHRAHGDEAHGFLGCASKPRSTVCHWFGPKLLRWFVTSLASKPLGLFLSVCPQN
jgi:hypothetical protein